MLTIRKQQMAAISASMNKPAVLPCEKHWIEIVLVDEDGHPVAGSHYRVELPDGSAVTGTLDEKGRARLDNIVGGTCQVSFPDRDTDSWTRI